MKVKNDIIEVSVLIPNYNYGRYIERCITSVLESEFDPNKMEIVVVDDASTDNSLEIVNKIKSISQVSINVISKNNNTGLAKTRNQAIQNAKGNYLFFLDSDNYIRKDCITKHYEVLSKNADLSACYAPIQKFDDISDNLLGVFSNEAYDFETLCIGNYIDAMAMFKKNDLVEVGSYDKNMPLNGLEDYELWLRMGVNNKKVFFIAGEPLSYYRVHADSMINAISLSNQAKLIKYIKAKYNIEELENHINEGNTLTPIYYINIKMFWRSVNEVFSNENSVAHQTMLHWNEKKIKLQISPSENVDYLRFDIGEQPGILNIHNIIIKDNNKLTIWQWNPEEINSKENVLLIKNEEFWKDKIVQVSTNNDPQFVVKLQALTGELRSKQLYVEITLSAIHKMQYNLFIENAMKTFLYANNGKDSSVKEQYKNLQKINDVPEINEYTDKKYPLLDHIKTQKIIIKELINEKENYKKELDEIGNQLIEISYERTILQTNILYSEKNNLRLENEKQKLELELTTIKNQQEQIILQNRRLEELNRVQSITIMENETFSQKIINQLTDEKDQLSIETGLKNNVIDTINIEKNKLLDNVVKKQEELQNLVIKKGFLESEFENSKLEKQQLNNESINLQKQIQQLLTEVFLEKEKNKILELTIIQNNERLKEIVDKTEEDKKILISEINFKNDIINGTLLDNQKTEKQNIEELRKIAERLMIVETILKSELVNKEKLIQSKEAVFVSLNEKLQENVRFLTDRLKKYEDYYDNKNAFQLLIRKIFYQNELKL